MSKNRIGIDEILMMKLEGKLNNQDDWNNLCIHYKLSKNALEQFKEYFDFKYIFKYQKLTNEYIENNFNKKYIEEITCYQKLSEKLMQKHLYDFRIQELVFNQTFSQEFIEKNLSYFGKYFNYIIQRQKLDNDFLLKHIDKIEYKTLIARVILPKDILEQILIRATEYNDKACNNLISQCQNLTEDLIEKYINILNLHILISRRILSCRLADKYMHIIEAYDKKINAKIWRKLSGQKLEPWFIEKYKNKLNMNIVKYYN